MWNPDEGSFDHLTGLKLRESIAVGIGHSLGGSAYLGKFILPSSQTLVTLTISIPHVWGDLHGFPLRLPRLSKLRVKAPSIGCLVHILENITAQILKNLILQSSTEEGVEAVHAMQSMPVRALDFSSVKYVAIEMPANRLVLLFERLVVPNAEGLSMTISNFRIEDTFKFSPPAAGKLHFEKLRSLHVDWKPNRYGPADADCVATFFDFFDFSHASEHVSISLSASPLSIKLDFPQLKKYSVVSLQDLSHISAPALQHLYLPLMDLRIKRSWKDYISNERVPLDKITILQLGILSFRKHIPGLDVRLFSPFTGVTTLFVSHYRYFASHRNEEYNWPKCWQQPLSKSWLRRRRTGRLFPKLVTLQVALPEAEGQDSVLSEIILEIEMFLQSRKKQGYPIRTLLLNFTPPTLRDSVARLAEEVEEFRIVEHRREEDLKWLTNARIWPLIAHMYTY